MLLAFIIVKTFVYLEVLCLLALVRFLFARRAARWMAALALGLAVAGLGVLFAPAWDMAGGAFYAQGARGMAFGAGMGWLLVASAPLVVSAFVAGRRWVWIDVLHGLLMAGLLGLWVWSLI